MNNRCIGKIINVSFSEILVEVDSRTGRYVNFSDDIYFAGQINSFVLIEETNKKIIGEIVGIQDQSFEKNSQQLIKPNHTRILKINLVGQIVNDKFKFGVRNMPGIFSNVKIIMQEDLKKIIGVKDTEIKINPENTNSPTRLESLIIGKSPNFSNCNIQVDIDKFFGFHTGIFGNTGSGKSNTIARLLQNIFQKDNNYAKNAKFIIFDSNGEYKKSLVFDNENIHYKSYITDVTQIDDCNKLIKIPVWMLTVDDWAILLNASEKTQIPIIRRTLNIVRAFNIERNTEEIKKYKNHIIASSILDIIINADSTPSARDKAISVLTKYHTEDINLQTIITGEFSISNRPEINPSIKKMLTVDFGNIVNIQGITDFFNTHIDSSISERFINENTKYDIYDFRIAMDFAILYEGSVNTRRIHEFSATLRSRLDSIIESDINNFFEKGEYSNAEEYVSGLFKLDETNTAQIVNIDVSSIDDVIIEVISRIVAKILFDYLKGLTIRASQPIHLILEEAHRYLTNTSHNFSLGYNIFERIAREGRKFGLILIISSQRPSELSKTVVSQCSNFIIHKIMNPEDLTYISKITPFITSNIINQLTYLPVGDALVFGHAVSLPILVHFQEANPKPNSLNCEISKIWFEY